MENPPTFTRPADGAIVSPQRRAQAAQYRFVVALLEEVPEALSELCDNLYPLFVELCDALAFGKDHPLNLDDLIYKLTRETPQPAAGPPSAAHSEWFNSPETQARIVSGELKLCGPKELMEMGLIDDPRYDALRLAFRAWRDRWHLRESWFLGSAFWILDMSRCYGPSPTPDLIAHRWNPGSGGVVTDWLNPAITLQWRQDLESWAEFEKVAVTALRQMRDNSLAKAKANGYAKVGVLSWKYFRALVRHVVLEETFEALCKRLGLEDSRSLRREVNDLRKIACLPIGRKDGAKLSQNSPRQKARRD